VCIGEQPYAEYLGDKSSLAVPNANYVTNVASGPAIISRKLYSATMVSQVIHPVKLVHDAPWPACLTPWASKFIRFLPTGITAWTWARRFSGSYLRCI
jgi:hypothetical protein